MHTWNLVEAMFVILALLLTLIGFMLIYLLQRAAAERRRARWRTLFSGLIQRAIDWEGGDEDAIPVSLRISRYLRKANARELLTAELMSGKKALSGSAGSNLVRLYNQLGLEADSLRKLAAPAWHRKAQGVQELALMEQRHFVKRIYRLTNAHNEIVRMEAQAAIVQLYGFEGLRFLDVIAQPMSEWQQIHLLRILSRVPGSPSGKVQQWLQSQNRTVRGFARRLVEEHHLEDLLTTDNIP